MVGALLLVGLAVAAFVGFNIGGSSTGVAFGPAVGSDVVSKVGAAALMSGFALLGGWTVGRNVIETLGGQVVPRSQFTLTASIAVLFFIGFALFLSNVVGVPASTSMTAVGAIAGLGLATGSLQWGVVGRIVVWWLVSPILAFWVSGIVGRYVYPSLVERFAVGRSSGSLLAVGYRGPLPVVALGPNTTRRELVGTAAVVVIGCYMAFSAGASNVANAVAPLVGNQAITVDQGVLLGGGAIAVGAFTIARRTLDTMGNELTELPLLAALVVEVISATVVTGLSAVGIPASFVIIATMSIVGLGWGRATRTTTVSDAVSGPGPERVSVGALASDAEAEGVPTVGGDADPDADVNAGSEADPVVGAASDRDSVADAGDRGMVGDGDDATDAVDAQDPPGAGDPAEVPDIGEEAPEDIPSASDLFDPATTARVIALQNVVPATATVAAYLVFRYLPIV